MANILKPKRSNTVGKNPTTSDLASGEMAVNMADQKIWINNGSGVVQVGAGKVSKLGDVSLTNLESGDILSWNGTNWVNALVSGGGGGTVTSVAVSVPTGLSVSGSPITGAGTIAISLQSGYSIPTTSAQGNWDTAYSDRLKWDGGSTGLNATTARTSLGLVIGTNVQAYDDDLAAIAALAGTSGILKKTGANTWALDTTTYLTGITSSDVTTALGFTPYNATNPAGYITAAEVASAYQSIDGDLTAIAALSGTSGLLKKTAANTWTLDTTAYLTSINSSMVTTALGFTPEDASKKGAANGYASLDGSGLVPSSQLPSYVDDVLEYANYAALPGTGVSGKIYVAADTSKIYRWSGSVYIEITGSPGSTDSVTEGGSNLYFTTARARASISATQNISYNSSTGVLTGPDLSGYLTSSTAASTYQTQSGMSSYLTTSAAAAAYQPLDADLTAIAATTSTGLLKRDGAGSWSIDTATYLTSASSLDASKLTGTVATARLGTGTANSSTYLRGDGTWATVTGGGGGGASVTISESAPSSPTSGSLWWNSATGVMTIYYPDGDTDQWVEIYAPSVAGSSGSSGITTGKAIAMAMVFGS